MSDCSKDTQGTKITREGCQNVKSDFSGKIRLATEPYHIIGEICPKCNKETVWHPMYVGMAAPNRLCKSCGKIWVTYPKKIEIKGG